MKFLTVSSKETRKKAEVLVLPYWQGEKKAVAAFSKEGISTEILSLLEKDFKGESCEILTSYSAEGLEKRILLIGLGSLSECEGNTLRKAFAKVTDFCRKKKWVTVNCFIPQEWEGEILPILDGFSMANYTFDKLKRESLTRKPSIFLESVCLIGQKNIKKQIASLEHWMEGVNLTRNLVNDNADDMRAKDLVEVAKHLAKEFPSLECTILRQKELEKEKMGLLLAVNRGAEQEPALIVLHYRGNPKSNDLTVLIGKGITFDTGGLNLKPTGSMETMKTDMAGGAAVLGTMRALASSSLEKNVLGVVVAAENAVGSKAFKPGDVFISREGKSVEISNTDAEGRLVLADAFSYVQDNYNPSRMIDIATLTGGIVVALGEEVTGFFSNSEGLSKQLLEASARTGEKLWQMPLFPEYRKGLQSGIADIRNASTNRKASPCVGAAFLHQFVKKGIPWAHLDIGGSGYLSEATSYYPSHATGIGVKLFLSFLETV